MVDATVAAAVQALVAALTRDGQFFKDDLKELVRSLPEPFIMNLEMEWETKSETNRVFADYLTNNVDPVTYKSVWIGWLRWCKGKLSRHEQRHVFKVCDLLNLTLEDPDTPSTRSAPRYPLCDREPQMQALANRLKAGPPLQRVLVYGEHAMGQPFFGLRCCLYPHELGVDDAVYVRIGVNDLTNDWGCWARLAAALGAPESESDPDPRSPAMTRMRARATRGRLALVHSPLPERGLALDVLAKYHKELAGRLDEAIPHEERLSERVLVVQTVEEPAPTGLDRLRQALFGGKPELARVPPFSNGSSCLVLPPLTSLTRSDLERFRDSVLRDDAAARDRLKLDEILSKTAANLQFREIREELEERDPIEP